MMIGKMTGIFLLSSRMCVYYWKMMGKRCHKQVGRAIYFIHASNFLQWKIVKLEGNKRPLEIPHCAVDSSRNIIITSLISNVREEEMTSLDKPHPLSVQSWEEEVEALL